MPSQRATTSVWDQDFITLLKSIASGRFLYNLTIYFNITPFSKSKWTHTFVSLKGPSNFFNNQCCRRRPDEAPSYIQKLIEWGKWKLNFQFPLDIYKYPWLTCLLPPLSFPSKASNLAVICCNGQYGTSRGKFLLWYNCRLCANICYLFYCCCSCFLVCVSERF